MKSKKILSVFLSVLMMVLTISPITAFARSSVGSTSNNISIGEDYEQKIKTEYSEVKESNTKTKVALTIEDSDLIVSVPTTIIVSGTPNKSGEYIGNYSVGVRGDMSGNKEVTIAPETSNIELFQKGKTNHDAAITQEKTLFNSDDFKNNVTTTGTVTTTGLTAGSWNGVTNFNIGVNILPAVPLQGYTVLYEYDVSATDKDNVKAYYTVPNKNTQKISVKKSKSKRTRAAANNANVVNYNGIQYTLSDEDTLVITGEGDMKPYINNDFYDYDSFFKDVANHFDSDCQIIVSSSRTHKPIYYNSDNKKCEVYFDDCSTKIRSIVREYSGIWNEISTYIDSIKNNYLINCPKNIIISEGIENIPDNVFFGMNMENITIPRSLKTIGRWAFKNCSNLASLNLENVTNVKNGAFYGCDGLIDLKADSVINIGGTAFSDCTSLVNIELGNNLISIGENAFYGCDSLINIKIPNGVTKIPCMAFGHCDKLLSVELPNSVTNIGDSAFSNCKSLININIPNSVTSIDGWAFSGCRELTILMLPASITKIGSYCFSTDSERLTIYCENQDIADLLSSASAVSSASKVIVAPEMFK